MGIWKQKPVGLVLVPGCHWFLGSQNMLLKIVYAQCKLNYKIIMQNFVRRKYILVFPVKVQQQVEQNPWYLVGWTPKTCW